jgi:hypothetical protein
MRQAPYSEADLEFLRTWWPRPIPVQEIARALGRTKAAIQWQAARLGLGRRPPASKLTEHITEPQQRPATNGFFRGTNENFDSEKLLDLITGALPRRRVSGPGQGDRT